MTNEGWGPGDPVKVIADYTKQVKALAASLIKVTGAARKLVAANPVGEMLKCKDVAVLAKLQLALQAADEAAKEAKQPFYNAFEAVRKQVLPPVMEDLEVTTVNVKGVGRVELRPDMFVSSVKNGTFLAPPLDESGKEVIGPVGEDGEPTKENWEAIDMHEWLARVGAADLISETVNSSSLKALIKSRFKSAAPVPDGLFNITPFTFAAVVKK